MKRLVYNTFKRVKYIFFLISLGAISMVYAQQDTASAKPANRERFDKVYNGVENVLKVFPVPIYSYSSEAGNIFGLAKFNLIKLSKLDTISSPSEISELVTVSTKGQINVLLSADLIWGEDKNRVIGYLNYKRQPEYILGIGNDVSIENAEEISVTRFKFVNYYLRKLVKDFSAGIGFDVTNYSNIEKDSSSFLIRDQVSGVDGGLGVGMGFGFLWDSRDNHYNAYKGSYAMFRLMSFPSFLGNEYMYTSIDFDVRKYLKPWFKHVIALQATTSYRHGNVPFYELAMLGGNEKMRGYYYGALRDNTLIDAQLEYRMPVWNVLGVVAWLGTGRVGRNYKDLDLSGFWLSYGFGLRLRIDSENKTNLRFDFGFGPGGISGTYISFAEAF